METFLPDYLERLYVLFFDPKKRLFLGYLMAAFLAAILVYVLAYREKPLAAVSRFFDRRIWLSPSARADYLMTVINQALMLGLLPRLLSKMVVAMQTKAATTRKRSRRPKSCHRTRLTPS